MFGSGSIQGIWDIAISGDWTRVVAALNGAFIVFKSLGADPNNGGFVALGIAGSAGNLAGVTYHSAGDKFYAISIVPQRIYRYNNDDVMSGEQLMTITGTTLSDMRAIAADGAGNIFVIDGQTLLKKFTVAAATLTFVASVTLDAPMGGYGGMAVDSTSVYNYDNNGGASYFRKYSVATGSTILAQPVDGNTLSTVNGMEMDPQGKVRVLFLQGNSAAAQVAGWLTQFQF